MASIEGDQREIRGGIPGIATFLLYATRIDQYAREARRDTDHTIHIPMMMYIILITTSIP